MVAGWRSPLLGGNAVAKGFDTGIFEKMMGMDDVAWERHTNPWSGWSRVSILPLFALAVWSRVWLGWWAVLPIAGVLLWTWLNPRLFKPPASTDNWMSQGVLGEKIWAARSAEPRFAHHRAVVRNLVLASAVGSVILIAGLLILNLALTAAGLAIAMISKLWFMDRMVWINSEVDDR